jgi:hypothetical protein
VFGGKPGDGVDAGRAYFCSDRRLVWRLLAISSGSATLASANCVTAEWRSWCSVHPLVATAKRSCARR